MSTARQLRIITSGRAEPPWHSFNTSITDHPEFFITEVAGAGLELLLAVRIEKPAAVILHGATEQSGISSHLFSENPDLTILKLYGSGKAYIEQRCPEQRQVVPTDPASLRETLRVAVEDPCSQGRPA